MVIDRSATILSGIDDDSTISDERKSPLAAIEITQPEHVSGTSGLRRRYPKLLEQHKRSVEFRRLEVGVIGNRPQDRGACLRALVRPAARHPPQPA